MSRSCVLLAPLVLAMWCTDAAVVAPRRVRRSLEAFTWKTCGTEQDVFRMHHMEVSPFPVVLPGTLYATISGEISRQVDNLDLKVQITKTIDTGYFGSYNWTLPCAFEVGSCTYADMCTQLASNESYINDIKAIMSDGGAPLDCPLAANSLHLSSHEYELPAIPSALGLVVEGDYYLRVEMLEHGTEEASLGCFEIAVSVLEAEEECDSWWCW